MFFVIQLHISTQVQGFEDNEADPYVLSTFRAGYGNMLQFSELYAKEEVEDCTEVVLSEATNSIYR